MKLIFWAILILVLTQLTSCVHKYVKNENYIIAYDALPPQKSDTLKVTHTECTECNDLYILEGKLTNSSILDSAKKYSSAKDIKVCGIFPIDLIDLNSRNYKTEPKFTVIGKVVTIDTANGIGPVPVFFVEEWFESK